MSLRGFTPVAPPSANGLRARGTRDEQRERDAWSAYVPDGSAASELAKSSERNPDAEAKRVTGDAAYGSGATQGSLGDCEVTAPTVEPDSRPPAEDTFAIDVEGDVVRCPDGHEMRHWTRAKYRVSRESEPVPVKRCAFSEEPSSACPRRAECLRRGQRLRSRTAAPQYLYVAASPVPPGICSPAD